MRWLVTFVVVGLSPTMALGQYTFGDWARDQAYLPGDAMPQEVDAHHSSPPVDSLTGIGEFDWTTTPTTILQLYRNAISSIEPGDFSGLMNLESLLLDYNQLSSIGPGDFSGLTNLEYLSLYNNQISNIESGAFNGLTNLTELDLFENQLSSIKSGDFSGLAKLTRLGLDSAWISSIEADAFSGLTNLTELNLSSNELSSIEADDFNGLTNLTRLLLDGNQLSSIESGDFSGLTNLTELRLDGNEISRIEADAFSGLTKLAELRLDGNQLSSIEAGAFSGLTKLAELRLGGNMVLTKLNLAEADFSNLTRFDVGVIANIDGVSLRNAVVPQTALDTLLDGGEWGGTGIGDVNGTRIIGMDLSGVDFRNITDLEPLYAMDDLTDLWLVDTHNLAAVDLDVLLDNLETIEGADTEGVLYMAEADFEVFNATGGDLLATWNDESGHHVEFLQIGDVNHDTEVNGLDVDPFVDVLLNGPYQVEADMNEDMEVNGLDVDPFVAAVVGGTQPVPEPSTLLLSLIALGVVGEWWKWKRAA
jgi:hypothetical protein